MRPSPNEGYEAWLKQVDEAELFTSVISVGELRRGITLLDPGARRDRFEAMQQRLLGWFGHRVLPVTQEVAIAWGDLSVRHQRLGRRPSIADELVAATALVHDLVVVTRNLTDFEQSGCKLLAPWR